VGFAEWKKLRVPMPAAHTTSAATTTTTAIAEHVSAGFVEDREGE
jgi:hypothetical protein